MALTNEKLQSIISVYNILRNMGQCQKNGEGKEELRWYRAMAFA